MTNTAKEILSIILGGFIATAAMSAVMSGSQRLGYSRLSLPFLVGTMFTGERSAAYVAGIVFYLLGGWLFTFAYYFVFAHLGEANWWFGGLLGTLHGLVLLVVLLP